MRAGILRVQLATKAQAAILEGLSPWEAVRQTTRAFRVERFLDTRLVFIVDSSMSIIEVVRPTGVSVDEVGNRTMEGTVIEGHKSIGSSVSPSPSRNPMSFLRSESDL